MDKEKRLLDCSQKLELAYKEENPCLTFWYCVQKTPLKKYIHLSSHNLKWNQ